VALPVGSVTVSSVSTGSFFAGSSSAQPRSRIHKVMGHSPCPFVTARGFLGPRSSRFQCLTAVPTRWVRRPGRPGRHVGEEVEMVTSWLGWVLVGCGSAEPAAVAPAAEAPAPAAPARAGKAGKGGRKEKLDAACDTSLSSAGGRPGGGVPGALRRRLRHATRLRHRPVQPPTRGCVQRRCTPGPSPAAGGTFRVTVEGASSGFTGSKRKRGRVPLLSGEWNPTFRVHVVER
jgi:hypothetical protein